MQQNITRATGANINIANELINEYVNLHPEPHIGPMQRNAFVLNTARTYRSAPVAPPTSFTYSQMGHLDQMVANTNKREVNNMKDITIRLEMLMNLMYRFI